MVKDRHKSDSDTMSHTCSSGERSDDLVDQERIMEAIQKDEILVLCWKRTLE